MKTINILLPIAIFGIGIALGHLWTKAIQIPYGLSVYTCYNQLYLDRTASGYRITAESTDYEYNCASSYEALEIIEQLSLRDAMIMNEIESPYAWTLSDTITIFDYEGKIINKYYEKLPTLRR